MSKESNCFPEVPQAAITDPGVALQGEALQCPHGHKGPLVHPPEVVVMEVQHLNWSKWITSSLGMMWFTNHRFGQIWWNQPTLTRCESSHSCDDLNSKSLLEDSNFSTFQVYSLHPLNLAVSSYWLDDPWLWLDSSPTLTSTLSRAAKVALPRRLSRPCERSSVRSWGMAGKPKAARERIGLCESHSFRIRMLPSKVPGSSVLQGYHENKM